MLNILVIQVAGLHTNHLQTLLFAQKSKTNYCLNINEMSDLENLLSPNI